MRLKIEIESEDYELLERIANDRNESIEYTATEIIEAGIRMFSWATGIFDWEF